MSQMYDPSTLGTVNNRITFNDYTAHPIFRVKHTQPAKRDIREQDAPIPNSPGVADFQAEEGKSYFVISGTMYASTEAEYYAGRRMLRKIANLDIQQSDPLSDIGYVPYTWTEAGQNRTLMVKVEYADGLDERTNKGYSQDFSLVCKVKYPAIIDPTAVVGTIGQSGQSVPTGSSKFPLTFPTLFGGSSYLASGSVVNAGDIAAYPIFNIFGPVNTPRITNTVTGEYLEVNVNLPTSSDVLTVSYDQDTAPSVLLNGVSQYNNITANSSFFKIHPGANNLQISGSSLNGGYATISFYSTWPLS